MQVSGAVTCTRYIQPGSVLALGSVLAVRMVAFFFFMI